MKTKTTDTQIVPARPRSLLNDVRGGAEFIQSIVLVVCLAIAGIAAVKTLSGKVTTKMNEAGDRVESEVQ